MARLQVVKAVEIVLNGGRYIRLEGGGFAATVLKKLFQQSGEALKKGLGRYGSLPRIILFTALIMGVASSSFLRK